MRLYERALKPEARGTDARASAYTDKSDYTLYSANARIQFN